MGHAEARDPTPRASGATTLALQCGVIGVDQTGVTSRVLLGLLLVVPCAVLAEPSPAPLSDVATAERMFRAWSSVEWGAAHPEWVAKHPGAGCRRPFPYPFTYPDEPWCFSCAETDAEVVIESRFYVLDPARDRACRLLELQIRARSEDSSEVLRQLETRLRERHAGVRVETEPSWWDPDAYRSDGSFRIWRTDGRIDFIYQLRDDPRESTTHPNRGTIAVLRATESSLPEPHGGRSTEHAESDAAAEPVEPSWRPELRARLGTALQSEFPSAAQLIEHPEQVAHREPRRRLVLELLAAAEGSAPERRAMLWLAADHLAAGFARPEFWRPPPDEPVEDWNLGIPGLTYELGSREPGDPHTVYHHDLLQRIWSELPHSEWRELAFLELQNGGWDFSPGCTGGNLKFEPAIARGEAYLAEHPQSHRAAQLLLLAQAHESRWSIGRSQTNDLFELDPALQQRAEEARATAESYYRRLVADFPDSPEAREAEPRLVRLETELPPNQWKFFCAPGC